MKKEERDLLKKAIKKEEKLNKGISRDYNKKVKKALGREKNIGKEISKKFDKNY